MLTAKSSARVGLVTVKTPFVYGGAEYNVAGFHRALLSAGHAAEIVAIPFRWYPPSTIIEQMVASRLLDLSDFDTVILMKFPAYYAVHPRATFWLLHQHRPAYELWDTQFCDLKHFPDGTQCRETIRNADTKRFGTATDILTQSGTVSDRLARYNGISSRPIYHPPPDHELLLPGRAKDYFFFAGRVNPTKRQILALQAMSLTRNDVKIVFAGPSDHSAYTEKFRKCIDDLGLTDRAIFLGEISQERKIKLYSESIAVIYPPFDEDYGYCTLEAMLSAKPTITTTDAGGPTEFVRHAETGLISEPSPAEIATNFDLLWEDRALARRLGQNARDHYSTLNIAWGPLVERSVEQAGTDRFRA